MLSAVPDVAQTSGHATQPNLDVAGPAEPSPQIPVAPSSDPNLSSEEPSTALSAQQATELSAICDH
eukprot:scaffold573808_cov43-Prasinocladus_malaysianus.AAC.1